MLSARLPVLVALVVLGALAVLALQCLLLLAHQHVPATAWRVGLSTVALTGVWWLLNGPLEGRVLVVLTWSHGFTAGDAAGVPALLLGLAVLALAVKA